MEKIQVSNYLINEFQYSEAIKTLRTNLIFSGESIKAVALTSCNKGEGKSTVSLQLACSFAQNNLKVLFIESDLSAGVLQNRLNFRKKIEGLSHYLAGTTELDKVVYPTDLGLDIIFAGTRVVNSSELLGSEKFDSLISDAKQKYDYIIVDAAPLGQIVDCAVIAHAVDGVLMVIDSNQNNYKFELKIKNQIEKAGGKVLGAVLNRAKFETKDYYYRKKYYNKYGYNYNNYSVAQNCQKNDNTEDIK